VRGAALRNPWWWTVMPWCSSSRPCRCRRTRYQRRIIHNRCTYLRHLTGWCAAAADLRAADLQPLRAAAPPALRPLPGAGTLALPFLLRKAWGWGWRLAATGAVAVRGAALGGGCALCLGAVLPAQILLVALCSGDVVEHCSMPYNIVSVLPLYVPQPK